MSGGGSGSARAGPGLRHAERTGHPVRACAGALGLGLGLDLGLGRSSHSLRPTR